MDAADTILTRANNQKHSTMNISANREREGRGGDKVTMDETQSHPNRQESDPYMDSTQSLAAGMDSADSEDSILAMLEDDPATDEDMANLGAGGSSYSNADMRVLARTIAKQRGFEEFSYQEKTDLFDRIVSVVLRDFTASITDWLGRKFVVSTEVGEGLASAVFLA